MSDYTINYGATPWPICKDGEELDKEEAVMELNRLQSELSRLREQNAELMDELYKASDAMRLTIGTSNLSYIRASVARIAGVLPAALEQPTAQGEEG